MVDDSLVFGDKNTEGLYHAETREEFGGKAQGYLDNNLI